MTKPDLYTPNIEALKELRSDSVTAWISEAGILHIVPLFSHLEFFVEQRDVLPSVSAYLDTFVGTDGKLSLSKPHMAAAMDLVYSHGWGRVGTYGGDKIELDCAREHVSALTRKAKAIARSLGRGLVCRVVHPSQTPSRKAPKPMARDEFWSSLREGFHGWIAPDGRIFEAPEGNPFGVFVADPNLIPQLAKTFETAVADDHEQQRWEFEEFARASDPDHIGWHRFYERPFNPEGDALAELTDMIVDQGWGRLQMRGDKHLLLEALDTDLDRLASHARCATEKVEVSLLTQSSLRISATISSIEDGYAVVRVSDGREWKLDIRDIPNEVARENQPVSLVHDEEGNVTAITARLPRPLPQALRSRIDDALAWTATL